MPHRLLIWTENYWVGGCDRFLADLVAGLRDDPVEIVLAGNRHPEFDAWLEARVPWALPREIVDVANMRESPLAAVGRRVGGGDGAHEGAPSSGFSVYGAGVAVVRDEQAVRNERKLRRLMRRVRPDVDPDQQRRLPRRRELPPRPARREGRRASAASCTSSTTWPTRRRGPRAWSAAWTAGSTMPPTCG